MAHRLARFEDLGARHPRHAARVLEAGRRILVQHLELRRALDVRHDQLEQEAVELRRRQRIGPGEVERVLGGDDEEEVVQAMGVVVDGDLLFGHRLQHRGLHLGRGPVDLVGEHHVREDRPAPEDERAGLDLEDVGAGDVARQQVGRELDAPKSRDALDLRVVVDRLAERTRQGRLARAGEVLEQHVPVGEERGEHEIDHLVAPANRGAQPLLKSLDDARGDLEALRALRASFFRF